MYGTNPTKQHEADARLQGDQLAADAAVRAARINASRPYAPKAERAPVKLVPIQTDQGIMLLNPETGELTPTGYKAPAKGGDGDAIQKILDKADLDKKPGGGFWDWLRNPFGGGNEQAAPGPQPQAAAQDIVSGLPPLTTNFDQGAALGLWPGAQGSSPLAPFGQDTEAKIAQMEMDTGLPREQIIAFLQQKNVF
jgi:hypothetical protein